MAEFGRVKCAIVVNLLIIVFVAYSIIPVLINPTVTSENGTIQHPLLFYTNWSNILAAIAAAFCIFYIHKGTRMPKAVAILKLCTTMMLTLTFMVVTFLFVPMIGAYILLDPSGNLFLHLIVPILAVVDFLFLANMGEFNMKDTVLALIPMVCYTIGVLTVIIISGNDDLAPYPFMRIHSQTVFESIMWFIILYGFGFGLTYLYTRLFKRFNPYVSGE